MINENNYFLSVMDCAALTLALTTGASALTPDTLPELGKATNEGIALFRATLPVKDTTALTFH